MASPSPDQPSWVVVDEWFDGEERHAAGPTAFKVEDGRIAAILPGTSTPPLDNPEHEVVHGAFLMPGLVDAHVHLFLDGAETDQRLRSQHLKQPRDALVEAARRSAARNLERGVTLVRDAGDRHGINHDIRAEARLAPDRLVQVRSAGIGIKKARRYGAFMASDVEHDDHIIQSVTALAADNDEIKLILTGIIDFDAGAVTDEPQFTVEEARLVVETAARLGRATFAHCSGAKGLEVAVAAGVGSVEHGFFMSAAILERMAERRIAWTPTFCPVHFQWAHPEAAGWSSQTVGKLRRILDDHTRHLHMAHLLGVPLLLGTDAGSMGVPHGEAMLTEIRCFLDAGLSVRATLTAATAAARRHFGLPHPRLAVEAPFDALLLRESPFDRLETLADPIHAWGRPVVEERS